MSTIGARGGKNPLKEFFTVQSLLPKAYTAATNGGNIDRYRNGGYFALDLELLPGLWTDGTHAFVIEEADDNGSNAPGTYTTVAATDLLYDANANAAGGTFTSITAATTTVQRIDYIGRKRWVRVRNTVSGQTTGAVYAVVGHLFSPVILPAA
jgi:hypothetical protein